MWGSPQSEKARKAVQMFKEGECQEVIAERLHVAKSTVGVWWLRWIVRPDWEILKKLAENDTEKQELREENIKLKARLLRYEDF